MEKLAFAASCLLSAHYALLTYMLLSGAADLLLLEMIFTTGILSILSFCATKYPYNAPICSANMIVAGMTSFYASVLINAVNPVSSQIYRMMLTIVYYLGGIRTVKGKFVEAEKVYARNLFFSVLMGLINIAYTLGAF